MEETIKFSGSRSPVTGFLSNESNYGFTLGKKKWPTVEHYIQAKKFVGTQHEETIRKARTVHQARTLARERRHLKEEGGKVVKKKVYGKGKEFHIREDWDSAKPKLLRKAMKAKFQQNKNLQIRLLETGESSLEDTSDPEVGPILEEIRSDLSTTATTPIKTTPPKKNLYKDIKKGDLSKYEETLIKAIINLALKVSILEGWDGELYPGMVEDAIYSMVKSRKHPFLDVFNEGQEMTWNKVYTGMPHYKILVTEIMKVFGDLRVEDKRRISMGLARVILEFRTSNAEERKSIRSRVRGIAKNLEGTRVRVLKKRRSYRKGIPPKIPERLLTRKEKSMVKLALEEALRGDLPFIKLLEELGMQEAARKKDFDTYIYQTLIELGGVEWTSEEKDRAFLKEKGFSPERISYILKRRKGVRKALGVKSRKSKSPQKPKTPPKFLVIKEDRTRGDIIVTGKPLKSHAHKLLGMGGKHPRKQRKPDRSRVRFPMYLRRDVEDYIFQTYPPEKKWKIAKRLWQGNKYLSLLDTMVQVVKLEGKKTIDQEMVSFVIQKIYRCHMSPDDLPAFDTGKDFGKCTQEMLKQRHSSFSLDSQGLELLERYVTAIESNIQKPTRKDLGRREYLQKLDESVKWGASGTCSSPEECTRKAFRKLFKLLAKRVDLPPEKICEGVFLILLPPVSLKLGAEQYIKGIVRDLGHMSPEKVQKKYDLDPSGSKCPELEAASIKYVSSLMKKPELSWMSRRILMMAGGRNKACSRKVTPRGSPKKYTKGDITGSKRSLVYDELLDPLYLSDEEYDEIVERWESLSPNKLLKDLNRVDDMSPDERKEYL